MVKNNLLMISFVLIAALVVFGTIKTAEAMEVVDIRIKEYKECTDEAITWHKEALQNCENDNIPTRWNFYVSPDRNYRR